MASSQLRRRLLSIACLAIISGCAERPPAWITELQRANKELCDIGISGPTYYAEDARAQSKAAAMTELARALQVKVKSQMVMHTSGDSNDSDTVMQETAGFTSEAVLKQSYVKEQWVNPGGNLRYGEKGSVYTLICMQVSK